MLSAIGGTPLVRLKRVATADQADVLVKLEMLNPTCSLKDRMALSMVEQAVRAQTGHTVVTGACDSGFKYPELTVGTERESHTKDPRSRRPR